MKEKRRLNLLAFPAETNILFALLILAVVFLSTLLGNGIAFLLGIRNSLSTLGSGERGSGFILAILPMVLLSGLAMSLVLGAAVLFYRRHPGRIRTQKKILPITEKDEKLREQVGQLAGRSGIVLPQVEMVPRGRDGSGGQAFGFFPHYSIRLDGGLRTWKTTRPDMFNAVVLHEFAHIANQDIFRSYFSDGIWQATLRFLILPFTLLICAVFLKSSITGILDRDLVEYLGRALPTLLGLLLQAGFMVGITAAIWARLLRVREFYADWKAVSWGAEAGLKEIFQEMIERGEKAPPRLPLFRMHPTAQERMGVIVQPELLFRISPALVFLVGTLTSFFLEGFLHTGFSTFLLFQEAIRWNSPRFVWFLFFALFVTLGFGLIAWLISGTLGIQIRRQSLLDWTTGQRGLMPYLKLIPTAFLFCAGLAVGSLGVPFAASGPDTLLDWIIELFIYLPAQAVATWLYFSYVRFLSMQMIAGNTGKTFSRWRNGFIQLCTTIWLFFLFIPLLILGRLLSGPNLEIIFSAFLVSLAGLLVLAPIAFVLTWGIVKVFFEHASRKCPQCGQPIHPSATALHFCEYCRSPLGEWLFVEDNPAAHNPESRATIPNLRDARPQNLIA